MHLQSKRFKQTEFLTSNIEVQTFSCDICFKTFTSPDGLNSHKSKEHTHEVNFSCIKCKFITNSRESFNVHIITCIYNDQNDIDIENIID